jgi:uncharacterized protein (DUF1778 family)
MSPQKRDRRWHLDVSSRSDALVREAARRIGQPPSAFVEQSAVARAQSVIAHHQPLTRSGEGFSHSVDVLHEEPVAVPALVELFSRKSRIPSAE